MLGMGRFVNAFESLLSSYFNSNVVCVSSGTSALHLALESLNLPPSSHVLVPSLTYVATFQSITAAGLIPLPVDIDPDTGNMSQMTLEKVFSDKCKAVVPVLYAGDSKHYRNILNWAKKKSLRVVCDAAHAFGSTDKGQLIGSFGDITCFSFDGIKNITSGEGGCIVSKEIDFIDLVKDKRLLAVHKDTDMRYLNKRSWEFDVYTQGWRYHMSNINASIGITQFHRRSKFFNKRRSLARYYDQLLDNSLIVTPFLRDYSQVVPHIYPVLINQDIDRDSLRKYMIDRGVQIGIHYKPNHILTFFKNNNDLVHTEKIYPRLISLPLHTLLTFRQIRYITSILASYIS